MPTPGKPRGHLFRKYAVLFVTLVGGALLASGLIEIYFSYQENKTALVRIQREKALAAASKIEQFIKELERQIGWTTQPHLGPRGAAFDQRRFDYLRLLRQVPAVTEISQLDASGKEQLRVSRLAMDVVASQVDYSAEPKFREAKSGNTYYSPVHFRKESEPYMTLSMAGSGEDAGVTVAEVNLKFIWDVVSQIKIGKAGYAYVLDARGHLIAHPDISLVLKKTDLSGLPHVQAARARLPTPGEEEDEATIARDFQGRQVLTAHGAIAPLGWLVFVDLPLAEAFAPIHSSILRTALLLLLGLALSVLVSLLFARRMVTPIRALQAGAARIGAGALDHRIEVRTGDELEALAEQFNSMGAQLQESYANLEQKVEARTRELSEALEQQTATSEVLRVISGSPTDLEPIYKTILASVTRLCEANIAALFRYDGEFLTVAAHQNASPEFAEYLTNLRVRPSRETATRRAALERRIIHIHDILTVPEYATTQFHLREGGRTMLSVPMLRENALVGVISIWRRAVRPFTDKQIELVKTFSDQAVIAIENVRLFQELQARTQDLAQSLEDVRALSEVSQAVSSSLDVQQVLNTIMGRAVDLSSSDGCAVFELDRARQAFVGVRSHNLSKEFLEAIQATPVDPRKSATAQAAESGLPVQIPDIADAHDYAFRDITLKEGFHALLSIPMGGENVVRGLVLFRRAPGGFDERVVNLLTTLANQSKVAIENARLFQEIQSQRTQLENLSTNLEQLYQLSTAMQEPLSLTEQLTRVLEAARQVVAIDRFYIWARTPEGDKLAALAGAGFAEEEWKDFEGVEIPLVEAGAMYKAYREGVPLAFNEQNPLPPELRLKPPYSQLKSIRTKSFLVVPMIARGQPVGCLTADNKYSGRSILPHTVELLQTFASHAAVAVENARLFQELQARTRDLVRSVEELKALGEVSRAVSSTLDLETVLTTIVARAVQLSRASGGVIYEFDEATREFQVRATHRMAPEHFEALKATPVRLGEGAIGRAAALRAPVQVPDVQDEEESVAPQVRPILVRLGYRSLLAVPLLLEEPRKAGAISWAASTRILGGLVVWRQEPGSVSTEVVNLLQTFATQSVLAIQNARLFREIEEKGHQLEIASRHKSQFLANMSHELRTPLNAILGYTELIMDNIYGEVPGKLRDIMDRVQKSGRHLLGLINDVLDLSKIEAGQLTLSLNEYSMKEVVQTVFTAVEALAAEKKLTLKVTVPPDLPPGRGDERRISQVLLNLVGNAIKFTEAGEIRIHASLADGAFLVSVSDTGPGIAPTDQQKIFEEFQQADSSSTRRKGGTGLGLAIAKRIIELHGGRIWVESAPGRGSTFRFSLPVRVER